MREKKRLRIRFKILTRNLVISKTSLSLGDSRGKEGRGDKGDKGRKGE